MSTPFRATINFFHHVIIYIAKIMGLLRASLVQRKVRYFIQYSNRDIELNYESDINESSLFTQIVMIVSKILVNSRKLLGLHVLNFYVFKDRTVICTMTSWRRSLNLSIYMW